MRFIDMNGFTPSAQWLADATNRTTHIVGLNQVQRSNYFDQTQNKIWNETDFFNSLVNLGKRKCWYSEANREVQFFVDHFRPKGRVTRMLKYSYSEGGTRPQSNGYYWLAYDYLNFRVANHKSNKTKAGYFPLQQGTNSSDSHTTNLAIENNNVMLLDPCVQTDVSLIMYSFNIPKPTYSELTNAHNYHRASMSIMAYDLNCKVLDDSRRRVLQKLHNLLIAADNQYQRNDFESFSRTIPFIVEMLNPESEFTMMVYQRLITSPEEWVETYVLSEARNEAYI